MAVIQENKTIFIGKETFTQYIPDELVKKYPDVAKFLEVKEMEPKKK